MSVRRMVIAGMATGMLILGGAEVRGQHTGDLVVGVDSNGQLVVDPRAFVPADNFAYLPPVDGLLKGFSDDEPGFDHVATAHPTESVLPLAPGAAIWLEVVSVDPAFRAIDDGFQILDQPGEDTELGDANLHEHVTWHINSLDPAYEPAQCVWQATFVLRDDGTTGYATSEPLVFSFCSAAVRAEGTPANGDFDHSGVVDGADFAALAACLAGPGTMPDPNEPGVTTCVVDCLNAFDFDDDRDVDLSDAAVIQRLVP